MISRTSGYALEALLAMARREGDGPARAARLAVELKIPANYLSKILNTLARSGILRSERGPSGGFRLARPADRVAIIHVVGLFEDTGSTRQCMLGRGDCSEENACPLHEDWKSATRPVIDFLRGTTLADLVEGRTSVAGESRDPALDPRDEAA